MLKINFIILFIFFIQVVPNFLDLYEKELDGLYTNKCEKENGKFLEIKKASSMSWKKFLFKGW